MDDNDDDKKVVQLHKGIRGVMITPENKQDDQNDRKDGVEPVIVADERIVNYLEQLLEDAKNGDVKAIAVVALKEPDLMRCWYRAQPGFSNALFGAANRMIWKLNRTLDRDD